MSSGKKVKIEYDEVVHNVNEARGLESDWRARALEWEKCYSLLPFEDTREDAEKKGLEYVVDASPQNVVDLGLRLFPDFPVISVPSQGVEAELEQNAMVRKEFLNSLWQRSSKDMGLNVMQSALWHGLVHGKFAFGLSWVNDSLRKNQQGKRSPILIQPLNPFEVSQIKSNGVTTSLHWEYWEKAYNVARRYEGWKKPTEKLDTNLVRIINYWWLDNDGVPCNVVFADGDEVVKAKATDYPDIPIVISGGDWSPSRTSEMQWRGILSGKVELWKYKCRLLSLQAQGIRYFHDPATIIINSLGMDVEEDSPMPGETRTYPAGTEIRSFNQAPNTQLSESMLAKIEAMEQQNTFPSVSYGESPSGIQSGYGVSTLADAAARRVNALRQNMEWAMEYVNEVALGMVESMADSKGVTIWGRNESTGSLDTTTITKEDINGVYDNDVDLSQTFSGSSMQEQNMALRWQQSGVVSGETLRNRVRILGKPLPADEEKRVLVERLLSDPQDPHARAAQIAAMAEKLGDPEYAANLGELLRDFEAQVAGEPEPEPNALMEPQQIVGPPDGSMPLQLDPAMLSPEMAGMNRNDPAAMLEFQQLNGAQPSVGAPTEEELQAAIAAGLI